MKQTSAFAILFFFMAGLVTYFLNEPNAIRTIESLPQVCPLKRFTGLKCAFCGMTHAWIYFWHGSFAEALRENVLSIALFVFAPLFLLSVIFSKAWTPARLKTSSWILLITLLSYSFIRNF